MFAFVPKAPSVERLAALQAGGEVLEVVRELLVFPKLHHVVEVLHVLDHRVELQTRESGEEKLETLPGFQSEFLNVTQGNNRKRTSLCSL